MSGLKASTLSTSTSSFEAANANDQQLSKMAVEAFDKIENYLQEELAFSIEDYKVVETMNKVTTAKYADLVNLATGVKKTIEDLNGKSMGKDAETVEAAEVLAVHRLKTEHLSSRQSVITV
ncbi:biogenesis of lysosome-related organelles complex 1 subunit 2-like isoform X2 [Artemia franciscana]|uniref:biogenesis of lysosome-related organelles complex 1 subunit 2-like isoform X2 n=1 Tax=Artemia franciscana TaxID=6661 RepID=UPI0032DA2149